MPPTPIPDSMPLSFHGDPLCAHCGSAIDLAAAHRGRDQAPFVDEAGALYHPGCFLVRVFDAADAEHRAAATGRHREVAR